MCCRIIIGIIFSVAILQLGPINALGHNEKDDFEELTSYMELMDDYFTIADKWLKLASSEEAAVFFVVEKISEIHEKEGDQRKAIPELRKILTQYKNNPTIRNMVHFKIVEIYEDSGQSAKALAELQEILKGDYYPNP